MPVVAFTFGSLGDILGVVQLAFQVRAALGQGASSSPEVRALAEDVDTFTRILQEINVTLARRRTSLRPEVVNGISFSLDICGKALREAEAKLHAFERRMPSTFTRGAWRRYWAIALWAILGGSRDISALRCRLFEQVEVINLYLALSDSCNGAAAHNAVMANATTLARMQEVLTDIQGRFDFGIPPFQFFDVEHQQYYRPCARTSLQRLCELHKSFIRLQYAVPFVTGREQVFASFR
ncbi:hypothetical protein AURDEDRAFT_172912 [Auricularia subglabra TFB-10046 SS5]|nr:hypothetical protein AURDEDRAFT_172912 [Auricularia subglabra TFB-10046 SS5]